MQWMGLLALACTAAGPRQTKPFRLDAAGEIAGLPFGQLSAGLPDFNEQFRQQGKPRMSTRLYRRLRDTVRLGGVGQPDSYWFRQGRFIGVDVIFNTRRTGQAALKLLVARYGPAQTDSTAVGTEHYWLGKQTFIMLNVPPKGSGSGGDVMLGSLAMLNELVRETAVRARARQLGWHPDSLGLPKQFPVR